MKTNSNQRLQKFEAEGIRRIGLSNGSVECELGRLSGVEVTVSPQVTLDEFELAETIAFLDCQLAIGAISEENFKQFMGELYIPGVER